MNLDYETERGIKEAEFNLAKAQLAEQQHWQRFRDEAALRLLASMAARPEGSGIGADYIGKTPFEAARKDADDLVAELRANPWKLPDAGST